jgi:hypothetical protein
MTNVSRAYSSYSLDFIMNTIYDISVVPRSISKYSKILIITLNFILILWLSDFVEVQNTESTRKKNLAVI